MAAAFNLTAQINLRGPANIKPIVSKIQKDINNAKIKLNLDVNQNAAKSITSITTRLNNLSKAAISANTNISNLNISLGAMVASLNNINSAATANVNSIAKTSRAVSSAGKSISQTRTQVEEFGKQSGLAIKRFAAFSTVTTIVYGLVNAFDSAFKEFFKFNQEIVRLSQVTGKSVSELGDVSKEITRLSTSLGVASSDLLTVATTLAQAGLSAEDTKIALEALAKSALAPSFDSLTDTTEGAIAALRQFGLQSKELDSALGSINAVAAAFAVEASDIIAAIQRTGGVFASASRGVSQGTDALNEFIAIFTSVRATTRESAETIATGLRTIFTRIQRTKTIEQLREFGIELQDTEGKFIGLFEATRRLSEGLSKIDPRTAEFATITEELGGFRQIGKVIPLIQQFAVTEQALAVAQKGSTSTAKDALVAQQSLAVQFARTRENFLALVREIGDSTSFKAFVTVSLTLADSFINLARALKPILPLLLTFASIKVGGALTEYFSGFKTGLFGGGGPAGGGGITPSGGGGGGGGTRGGGGTGAAALSANTSSLNTLGQTLTLLNQSILALNQNIVNTNSLLLNRPVRGFASGGLVPGSGNSDTFRANLTPGEFVIRKSAVQAIGIENLARMNSGGEVQKFKDGTKGRGVKRRRGARSKFIELSPEEVDRLSTEDFIKYAKAQAYDIMTTGGSGIAIGREFIEVPESKITADLEKDLTIGPDGKKGFFREKIAPFGSQIATKAPKSDTQKRRERFFDRGRELLMAAAQGIMSPASALSKEKKAEYAPELEQVISDYGLSLAAIPRMKAETASATSTLLDTIKNPLSSFRQSGGKTSLAGVFPGNSAEKIKLAIPKYIASLGDSEPQKVAKANTALQYFDSFISGGVAAKPGHATAFTETINQLLKSGLVQEFARGGYVQKFKEGSTSKGVLAPLKDSDILKSIFGNDIVDDNGNITAPNPIVLKQGSNKGQSIPRIVTPNDIRKNNKNALNSGLDITKIKQAQDKLTQKSVAVSEAKQALQTQALLGKQQAVTEDITRGQQGLANKIMTFGLVGLRYGSGAKGESSLGTFPVEVPPAFSSKDYQNIRGINVGTADEPQQKFIKIITSTISSQLGKDYAEKLQNMLYTGFESSVVNIAKSLSSESGLGASVSDNSSLIQKSIENAGFYNVVGAGLESALNILGAPLTSKDEDTKSIDFPTGLKSASKIFGSAFTNIPTDITRTIGPGGKDATKFIAQIERYFKTPMGKANLALSRFAMGGSVSEEDTVPALLTPGEFVFNKKAAKRIGYGNLNRLNKADKVQGFNKGGVVGYAQGGAVDMIGGAPGVIAAITAVILPQIEKLSSSFGKLDGTIGMFGTALGGAIREASSLTLSAGIALNTVGASKGVVAAGQAGTAISGLVSGALTDTTGKALEKALLKNVDIFGKFDKTVQAISSAPTEELRLQAAQDLQKTFTELDASVQSTKGEIDSLEIANNFGSAINDITLTILTSVTAITALSNAANKAASVTAAYNAVRLPANVAGPVQVAAPGVAAQLLGAFKNLIPWVGAAITVIEVGVQLFGAFNSGLKKSSEQLDRLYKNLDEATKNSQAFSLANATFVDKILPQFTQLKNRGFTGESLRTEVGRTPQIGAINELNFTFRTLLKSRLVAEGIPFSDMSTMQELVDSQRNNLGNFNRIFDETTKDFIQRQFVRAKTETGDITTAEAERQFFALGGANSDAVKRVVENYVGAKNVEIAALRELTNANNKFKLSLVTLDNVLVTLAGRVEMSLGKTMDQFDDLERRLSILGGEPRIQGGEVLRRQIGVLNNLSGASAEDLSAVSSTVSGLLNIQGSSPEQQKLFEELRSQVEAARVIQQELPAVLKEIQSSPQGRAGDALRDQLEEKLGPSLSRITNEGGVLKKIFNELAASVNSTLDGNKESINSVNELIQNNAALSALLKTSEKSQKAYSEIIEATAKIEDKLNEQIKFRLDLESKLIESTTQRLQLEAQEANELNRLLGVTASLSDLNKPFDIAIQQLTKNIGGGIPQAGTTDPRVIVAELNKRRQIAQSLDENIKKNQADIKAKAPLKNLYEKEISAIARLNQALNTIATSGEKTKNALDKIAEAQNKFDTSTELLFEFLDAAENPEQFIKLQQTIESINAAQTNRFTDAAQARLFRTEGTRFLKARGVSDAEIRGLVARAARFVVGTARPTNEAERRAQVQVLGELFAEGRNIGDIIGSYLPEAFKPYLSTIFPNAPGLAVAAGQQQRRIAGEAIEASLLTQMETSQQETTRIFNNFNLELTGLFPAIIENIQRIEAQTRASEQKLISRQQPIPALAEFAQPLSDILSKISQPTVKNFGIAEVDFILTPGALSKEQAKTVTSDFGSAQTATDQIRALNRALFELDTTTEAGRTAAEQIKSLRDELEAAARKININKAAQSMSEQIQGQMEKALRDAERNNGSRSPTVAPPPPGDIYNLQRNRNTPSSQIFDQTIDKFSASTNAIIQPMQDLSTNMSIFKTTAEKLSETLNRFSVEFNKEIKASISHSYTGDVNLNLNDTLDVNIQNNPNRDTQLVQNIYDKVIPVMKETIMKALLG
jgi:TP901 family phage tail tape measure protein